TILFSQESHSDTTIACQGKYFPAHKLVLSSCSKYFEEIFERTECKHPFIIINDLNPLEFEALMQYMYKGEVNVPQSRLPALIKAAEALNIKGLAIPDEIPNYLHSNGSNKKRRLSEHSPNSKRKRFIPAELPENQTPFIPTDNSNKESLVKGTNHSYSNVLENPTQDEFSDENEHVNINIKLESKEENTCLAEDSKVPLKESFLDSVPYPGIESVDPSQQTFLNTHEPPLRALNQILPSTYLPSDPEAARSEPQNSLPLSSERQSKSFLSGERRTFRCHYCAYVSLNRTHTINHMRRHTGEKPFVCSFCLRRFSLKHNLDRHMKSHKQAPAQNT
ncbi:UNVERIFIED_CONTAM: hypothetical protein GTU68_009820, partial [Idotea baltica]|nr:hypothetical protein [Idotea baltica]